jgi:hypothetical protein
MIDYILMFNQLVQFYLDKLSSPARQETGPDVSRQHESDVYTPTMVLAIVLRQVFPTLDYRFQ